MSLLLFALERVIGLGSIAAYVYLLWNRRWLVVATAIGFSILTPAITALVNWPMRVFWRELSYPLALTTPGLRVLVNPVRLLIVSRIPQLVYGGLAYCIGLAAFLLFSSSSHVLERVALMIMGYDVAFTRPTRVANTVEDEYRGAFLNTQLIYGKLAFLTLLIVHSITPLAFWPGAALLAVAMVALAFGFEVAINRRPLTG